MKIKEYSIELDNIHLYAYHGALPQENKVGGWYTLNLKAAISNHDSIESDRLETTVNYADIYKIVCNEMKIPSQLLEHVCGRILNKLFEKFKNILITLLLGGMYCVLIMLEPNMSITMCVALTLIFMIWNTTTPKFMNLFPAEIPKRCSNLKAAV